MLTLAARGQDLSVREDLLFAQQLQVLLTLTGNCAPLWHVTTGLVMQRQRKRCHADEDIYTHPSGYLTRNSKHLP